MGFAIINGPCWACKRRFSYNPDWVPSIPIDADTGKPAIGGERQALCRDCVEEANVERERNGYPPIPIHPEAYEPLETV